MYLLATAGYLSDPMGSRPLVDAVTWLEQTVLGTIATTVAVMAVASVGMLMLTGRLEIRRGLTVVGGCFILFGASSIVAGLQAAVSGGAGEGSSELTQTADVSPLPAVLPAPGPSSPPKPGHYDPYAGAAVPMR